MTNQEFHNMGLLMIAQCLHMNVTGASLELSPEEMRKYAKYLKFRLDGWKKPSGFTVTYDMRVMDLVKESLREWSASLKSKGSLLGIW